MHHLRTIFGGCVLFALLPLAAHANPIFTYTFDPGAYNTANLNGGVSVVLDITNTGLSTITRYVGSVATGSSALPSFGPYETSVDNEGGINPAPGAPALYNNNNLNLAPGSTGKFTLFSLTYVPAIYIPVGTYYIGLDKSLTLADSTGSTTETPTNGLVTITNGSPVPEPSSYLLVGTGIVGAAGAVRRRIRAV